jgi:hypothetical protein
MFRTIDQVHIMIVSEVALMEERATESMVEESFRRMPGSDK